MVVLDEAAAAQAAETCERVLALVGERGEALATASVGTSALTRFANSRIHQNVSEDVTMVSLTVAVGEGQVAQVGSTRVDAEAVDALVERALEAARLAPADPEFAGFADSGSADNDHADPATAAASPDDRARIVADFVKAAGDMEAAGYCTTEASTVALATSGGQRLAASRTMAQLDGIHRATASGHPADGYAQATSTRIASIDGAAMRRDRRSQGARWARSCRAPAR